MIYYVEGKLALCEKNLAVVDVNGVGFSVSTSMYTIGNIKTGEKVKLYTHLIVREDDMELVGFASQEELRCFKMITSISGVGAKVALSILSTLSPSALALAIAGEDLKAITNAPGVGKKLASRIVLELKDKMLKSGAEISGSDLAMPQIAGGVGGNAEEAIEALMVLGYSKPEAMKAVSGAPEGSSVEDIIRFALKNLVIPY
ncbi:MAG: Holliday junction branch migration protein RuvA [Clostridia bacterium]|nr:Holliday junction branch migration protein RuvA [Clostridia bacterium]MBR6763921.1 Holliday junction branch migration protein RuvA [Clostridia bacterium]